jgi:hypothetical protein
MKSRALLYLLLAATASAATGDELPYLQRQGTSTRLIVDGQPFLILGGELGNNTASTRENMAPVWSKLTATNLNCVLAAVSWAQIEPREGAFDFTTIDGLIEDARANRLRLVFLWFGSWKNGLSSYAPAWVKADYQRFPRIRLQNGRTMELLTPLANSTRDADARAFRALMRHLRAFDGREHTVLMMQVENEVGVLRDSRDRSAVADAQFAGAVPAELMAFLSQHADSLAPELRELWTKHGARGSGTWEEVFGPGKPRDREIPIQTNSPPLSTAEYETGWRELHWPVDEIFMAWHYARLVEHIIVEGKAEYPLPMFVNAWLQQRDMAWPGTYPSGGPVPQVHDIWRAGAPHCDFLAPDIYIPEFEEACDRFSRNGNALFVPETRINASNALLAIGKHGSIGYSPFNIDLRGGADTPLASAYRIMGQMAPVILANQGSDRITAVRMLPGDAPRRVKLGNYTLELAYIGQSKIPIAPRPPPAGNTGAPSSTAGVASTNAPGNTSPAPDTPPPYEAAAVLVAAGTDEFYFGGGGFRISFTPNSPGPATVGLGDVQEGKFVGPKWVVTRQLGGDDTGQGEILSLKPDTLLRVTVYRYE